MPEIFVSYRREDSHLTARLVGHLRDRFGEERVFRDRDSIAAGQDFARVIERDVTECRVLLAVIGTRWLQPLDDTGRRRIDDPHDFVRLEVATALKLGKPTIPILADGAALPRSEHLPEDLAKLPGGNALKLDDERFDGDVARLIEHLEKQYRILRRAKERVLAFVRGLSQFIAVLLLARVEWEWLGCVEAAAAFGLSGLLARQPRRDASPLGSLVWSALQGGAIGGALAGLLIGIGYDIQKYRDTGHLRPAEFAEIMLFAMFVGAIASASAEVGMGGFRFLAKTRRWPWWFFNDAFGGVLGCVVGVTVMGMIGGLLFGGRAVEPIDPALLALVPLGTGVAIVLYDTGGRWFLMTVYAVVPGLLSLLAVAIALWLFDIDLRAPVKTSAWLSAGAKIGIIFGIVMGLHLGLAMFWYRFRSEHSQGTAETRAI